MKTPDIIKQAARDLRKNMTDAEIILWSFIKGGKIGVQFLRQKPIYVFTEDNGLDRYIIPDFYCHNKKLILEIDGNIHDLEEVYRLDIHKTKLMKNRGFKIIRIKNEDILADINHVIQTIKTHL